MQFHTLHRVTKLRKMAPVGRGGKRGKTSGRGGKGQTARAGHKVRPEIRDTIMRLPKLRGRGINTFKSFAPNVTPISLSRLDLAFEKGETVTIAELISKKVISIRNGKTPNVKILGGEMKKSINIKGLPISASAKASVEKAGGKVTQ